MPQRKKKFRFKIPWISGSSRAPPPPTESQSLDPKQGSKSPQQHPPSRPPQSPTSSVIVDSPVSSTSHSPSRPSTPTHVDSPLPSPPRISHTQDLLLSHEASPSHLPSGSSSTPEAPPQPPAKETTHPATPLKVTPKELELETQSKTYHPPEDKAKEIAVIEHEPIKVGKGNANDTKHRPPKAPANRNQKAARESIERKMLFSTFKVESNPPEPATRNVNLSSTSTRTLPSPSNPNHLQKGIKEEISNFVQRVATVNPTTHHTDDRNVSVVTLAGENRGATMHVGSNSSKKEGSIHIHRAYRTDPDEVTTTDADENSSSRNSIEKDEGELGNAYVNSNIQSVNNSLMMHGSVSERDPGVRMVLPQRPAAEPPVKPPPTSGGEVRVKREEKTSNEKKQPVVRRRCLRGLLMEPSDSDPDNPDKPRRHGCKFRCGDNTTDLF